MKKARSKLLYNVLITAFVIGAALGMVRFIPEIPWEHWPQLGLFAALTGFMYARSVTVENQMNYSLGTAAVFPAIFLYGTGAGILISLLAGFVDFLVHRKSVDRALFNMGQLSLSAVACGAVYGQLGGTFGYDVWLTDIWAMLAGGIAYIVVNVGSVTIISTVVQGRGIRRRLRRILRTVDNDLIAWFWGTIFTLFAAQYSTWGIVLLGIVFIQFSRFLEMRIKISVERGLRQELERELLLDSKTGVYNFRYLNQWLSDPAVEPMAALFIDIDDFKVFNDEHGHAAGDKVLIALAQLIQSVIRSDDKVIRYGGEEFVVLLPKMTRTQAEQVACRIQMALAGATFARQKGRITVSIGIAACPEDTVDKHQLLALADQAMYQAKRSGKNCCHSWGKTAAYHSI